MNETVACNAKPRICIIAHNAYGALAGIDTGHVGGIERQTSLMGRWFARAGHDVSMVTWDEGQLDGDVVEGVRVFKMCRRGAGIKGLRFLWPQWTSLYRAMLRADADIYYYNCGDLGLGQVAMWTRRYDRKCVYSVASDPDCDSTLPALKSMRERFLYRFGLKHADSIVVQTEYQKKMLQTGYGLSATVIPMPCDGFNASLDLCPENLPMDKPRVLWVGRISKEKRFEWLLDVAKKCRELTFDVVGATNVASEYASALVTRAAEIPNVQMHGRVLYTEMSKYYQRARVLCCTSAYEGFPNTFLEAWSLGVPVVSTFDPDGVIKTNKLGFVAHDKGDIVSRLVEITQSPEIWLEASNACKQYFMTSHAMDMSLPRFEQFLLSMA